MAPLMASEGHPYPVGSKLYGRYTGAPCVVIDKLWGGQKELTYRVIYLDGSDAWLSWRDLVPKHMRKVPNG